MLAPTGVPTGAPSSYAAPSDAFALDFSDECSDDDVHELADACPNVRSDGALRVPDECDHECTDECSNDDATDECYVNGAHELTDGCSDWC